MVLANGNLDAQADAYQSGSQKLCQAVFPVCLNSAANR